MKRVHSKSVEESDIVFPSNSTRIEAGMFFSNKRGINVFIKDVENNLVAFDEEGTERILTIPLAVEYFKQEGYTPTKRTPQEKSIKETVETNSIKTAISNLLQ